MDPQPWIQGTGRTTWRPRAQACCQLSRHGSSSKPRWRSASAVNRRHGPVVIDHHLTCVVRWVPRELESMSALIRGRNYENRHTKNLQEMALVAFSNIRSSRPPRPVNFLRSASPIFMPGRPFTVKVIRSDRLKSRCLLP